MKEYEYYNIEDCIKQTEFNKYIRSIFKSNKYKLDRVNKSLRKEIYRRMELAAYCSVKSYINDIETKLKSSREEVNNPF